MDVAAGRPTLRLGVQKRRLGQARRHPADRRREPARLPRPARRRLRGAEDRHPGRARDLLPARRAAPRPDRRSARRSSACRSPCRRGCRCVEERWFPPSIVTGTRVILPKAAQQAWRCRGVPPDVRPGRLRDAEPSSADGPRRRRHRLPPRRDVADERAGTSTTTPGPRRGPTSDPPRRAVHCSVDGDAAEPAAACARSTLRQAHDVIHMTGADWSRAARRRRRCAPRRPSSWTARTCGSRSDLFSRDALAPAARTLVASGQRARDGPGHAARAARRPLRRSRLDRVGHRRRLPVARLPSRSSR